MPSIERFDRQFAPTTPEDLNDPPRFGQPTETCKDILVLELRKYFANTLQTSDRRFELPTIEKYATFSTGTDPFSTSVEIVRKHPDRLENLPHIAVLTTSGSEKKLTVGPPYVTSVQDPPRILAALPQPYALVDGDILVIRTLPDGRTEHLDIITFTASRFPTSNPITAARAVDVARVINELAAHCRATTVVSGPNTFVQVEAGGVITAGEGRTPTELSVHPDSSASARTVFGLARTGAITDIGGTAPNATITAPATSWSSADIGNYVYIVDSTDVYFNDGRFPITAFSTLAGVDTLTYTNRYALADVGSPATWFIGTRDTNANVLRPPKHRYVQAFDLSCQIDVICDDENQRGEVCDLVLSFFTFFAESKYFTFWGRSDFDATATTPNEYFQIVLKPPMRISTEAEFPRTQGDLTGKLYINSFTVDVTFSNYLDRIVYWPGTTTPFLVGPDNVSKDETLPMANSGELHPQDNTDAPLGE